MNELGKSYKPGAGKGFVIATEKGGFILPAEITLYSDDSYKGFVEWSHTEAQAMLSDYIKQWPSIAGDYFIIESRLLSRVWPDDMEHNHLMVYGD